jgi:hypothetical protein
MTPEITDQIKIESAQLDVLSMLIAESQDKSAFNNHLAITLKAISTRLNHCAQSISE